MEPTGYYGADYMSAIYGADFLSDIYGADSMVGHIRSWPDTHDSFKGMWNYRRYTVNCSLYKRKRKRDACMHR